MKRWLTLLACLLAFTGASFAQGTTPNIHLNTPAVGTPNWGPLINQNMTLLDLFLSGNSALPGLDVSGLTTLQNVVINGTCTGSGCGGGGGGSVTNFTAGNLSPLFTTSVATPTSTPALTFTFTNFAADAILGNFTGLSAAPSTQSIPACANDGQHALSYPSHTLTCTAFSIPSTITFQTNGVANGSQTLLNLIQGSNITVTDDGVGGVTIASSSPGIPCTSTAGSLQYNNSGSFGCVAPFTFSGSTITASSSGILNLGAAPVLTGFIVPKAAGAAPTAAGNLAYNSTTNRLTHGDGSTTQVVLDQSDVGAQQSTAGLTDCTSISTTCTYAAATAHRITNVAMACADSSGSGATQVCNTTPTFTPAAGDSITYSTTTQNSGALTLNVNSQGAKPVKKWLGSALSSGDIPANIPLILTYDGTNWNASTIGNAPGGTRIITLVNAVNQGTGSTGGSSGVSVSCSYPFVAANSYAQKGDGTHPQLGMAQFQVPGALVSTATGVRMDCAFTMPSNYTANSNITVKGLAGCVLAGGPYNVTVSSNYSDITLGGALDSTLSADFSSASTSVATVPTLTAFTLTITSPTINPGDLVSISTRISSDASGCAPVVPQMIASY